MSNESFPYMPLYWRDWLTGQSTTFMTAEQEGGFLNLLLRAWGADPPCTVPDDDAKLALLSKLGPRWAESSNAIREQFLATENGLLRNTKQWSIYQEMVAHRERRKEAGAKGGAVKAKARKKIRKSSNARAMLEQCGSNAVAKGCPSSASARDVRDEPKGSSRRRGGWPAVAAATWATHTGGRISVGKIAGIFKETVAEHGEVEVLPLWDKYLESLYATGQDQYASATNFVENYGRILAAGGQAKPRAARQNNNGRSRTTDQQQYGEGTKEVRWVD